MRAGRRLRTVFAAALALGAAAAARAGEPVAVMVSGFTAAPGWEASARALTEAVREALAERPGVVVVTPEEAEALAAAVSLPAQPCGGVDETCGEAFGRMLGAARLVTGRVGPGAGGMAVEARMTDLDSGAETARVETVCAGPRACGRRIAEALGAGGG
ncbi:hypothetical protein [Deferrisoma sp.]